MRARACLAGPGALAHYPEPTPRQELLTAQFAGILKNPESGLFLAGLLRCAGATVLRFYREWIATAPEAFGGFPAWQIAPPLPFIPENRHGEPFLAFVACWAGPIEEGERALKPLHDVAAVVAEHVGQMPYPAMNIVAMAANRR